MENKAAARDPGDRDLYRQFQEWCLKTYGDSGKTKTVTRKKYDRIVQFLSGTEPSSADNAKFKFWVKSKGFQLGSQGEPKPGAGKQVLYVPVKTPDGVSAPEKQSLKRVAVVEDFFDIIYSMHVEIGANGEKSRKHAGQKRTYKAISETYAFLPREAVTRFLMSCSECQKRMHLNPDGADHKENEKPTSLGSGIIDYNMPITMAYMKHMKLQLLNSHQDEDEHSLSSEEFELSDSTWMSVDRMNSDQSSTLEERMHSPQNLDGHQDEDSSVECFNGNEALVLNSNVAEESHCGEMYESMADINGNGTANADHSASQDEQPINLSDSPLSLHVTPDYGTDNSSNGRRSRIKYTVTEIKMERDSRELGSKSPAHSYSSYESLRNESVGGGPEDLSVSRTNEDDDDQDDHDDVEKINESDGAESERLKAFNSRPIPSHLTSAVAENILATACESESRNAAKRMRLDVRQQQQDEPIAVSKQWMRESTQVTYTTPAVSYSQELMYINGNASYSYHGYGGLGSGKQNPSSLSSDGTNSGPADLSVKKPLASHSGSSNINNSKSPPAQLSPTEINAVRQLVAGYRESAAFLLRSADELENLILQQN
ncbi:nucleolar protein 4 isoform X2 [Callorhinchus milii]|uniref:Nucleolar protein 4 n=1 Tax=Callorhinchus milii TaxID=7868 RepID=A0A4W3H0M9_CALMI|nr:nucleolar protein 4 isoform X2 [Callorhinchus milii]|eukprot:gi/632941971/ref/XP_007886162.1/ PREDICTED: nucleolar protein 4 isoform X2 [Callorhinchus milii]